MKMLLYTRVNLTRNILAVYLYVQGISSFVFSYIQECFHKIAILISYIKLNLKLNSYGKETN